MPRDGTATREKILAAGYDLVIGQGYAATTVDQIIRSAGITKGTFFHHFPSKDAMADAMFEAFTRRDEAAFAATFGRAEALTKDPLQQVLVAVNLMEEMFRALGTEEPGCLVAAYAYQDDLMTPAAKAGSRRMLEMWRDRVVELLEQARLQHRPRIDVDLVAVGNMLTVLIEGGFIAARIYGDNEVVFSQLKLFRQHIELLFDRP
jgi:TetR/AcrR family transcriptional repressor of nem operon